LTGPGGVETTWFDLPAGQDSRALAVCKVCGTRWVVRIEYEWTDNSPIPDSFQRWEERAWTQEEFEQARHAAEEERARRSGRGK
jgi:hypothetical protein